MPKMPEVTVHVTAEPDPKETQEHKASADMWAEQCRTLQRTLLDTQIEREALRVRLKHAQHGLGEGITRPHDAPEGCPTYYDGCNCTVEALVHNIERAEKAEARVAELEAVRDDLSRAYAVQGLALEEERTRVAELEAALNAALDDDWEQPDLVAYRVMRSGWEPE